MSLEDELRRAADPDTPLDQLHYLAQNVPETRPAIAANPNTYPELLEWLSEFDDPDIAEALATRGYEEDWPYETNEIDAVDPAHKDDPAHADDAGKPEPTNERPARIRTNNERPWYAKPGGIIGLITAIVVSVIILLSIIGGILYATGHRSSGLGGLVNTIIHLGKRDPQSMADIAPDDSENPGASQRGGTDAAKGKLALTSQERLVKDFPVDEHPDENRPVPPAAYTDVSQFQVDDGRVQCSLTPDHATCQIAKTSQDYGNAGGPLVLTVTSGGTFAMTEPNNTLPPTSQSAVLAPSAAVAQGKMVCQSAGSTVECWDAVSGHGFVVGNGRVGQF